MSVKTIREVSELSKVSVSALRYYDEQGLFGEELPKDERNQRVFDNAAIARLQQIMLYRELDLGISDIKKIFEERNNSTSDILNEQIVRLKSKARRFENLVLLAEIARDYGISVLNFNLEEEQIKQIVEKYKQAEKLDLERIKNMSAQDRITIATRLIGLLEKLIVYKRSNVPQIRNDALSQIEKFANLLTSTLNIQSVPLRSMARGVAGGGTISEMLDNYGGDGFASYVAGLMTEFADLTNQPEIPLDGDSKDYLNMLYSMWA